METNNIDSVFKKVISESPDYYNSEDYKEQIWNKINLKSSKKKRPHLVYPLAAACIGLLLLSTFLTVTLLNQNKSEFNTNSDILSYSSEKFISKYGIIRRPKIIKDTIFITNEVIKIQEKIITKPIEVITYLTDTIFIDKPVYQDLNNNNNIIIADENISDKNPKTTYDYITTQEILISNNDKNKNKKNRSIQFKFGGRSSDGDTGSPLSLNNLF